MKCVVIQEKWVPHYDAVYDRVGNILMTPIEPAWWLRPRRRSA
ncbi:hypothetical protein [Rhizobium beringeri]